jgi:hypothetical protein
MEFDKQQLKNIALRQRIGELTSEYEDKVANLRVEVTILTNNLEKIQEERDLLQRQVDEHENHSKDRELARDEDAA